MSEAVPVQPGSEAGDDSRLMDAIVRGEPRAFDAVVLRFSGELLRYARRLGLSRQGAEDVLQQSFLKAWIALDAGTEVKALRPWLYRIVHNNAINSLSRQREVPSAFDSELGDASVAHLEQLLEVRAALAEVAALPQMQRDAMLLSAVAGESHEDVARALGVSDGAVRGLLHRARRTLRAATAAVIPPPVVAWLASTGAKVAPFAGRAAEGSAGLEVGGEIAKGAAVAAAAAVLVAGVASEHHLSAAHAARHHPQAAVVRSDASQSGPATSLRSAGTAGSAGAPRVASNSHTLAARGHGGQGSSGGGTGDAGRGGSEHSVSGSENEREVEVNVRGGERSHPGGQVESDEFGSNGGEGSGNSPNGEEDHHGEGTKPREGPRGGEGGEGGGTRD